MRHSLAVLFLFTFSSITLAQTTVPNTFTAGTPAKASEVNADFQALATAIDNLATRVNKLEGQITSADVAGTYASSRFEVDTSAPGSVARIANFTENGTATLNADGTFSSSSPQNSFELRISGGNPAITATETPSSTPKNVTGTWSLSGHTLTLNTSGGSVSFTAAGSRLFISTGTNFDIGGEIRFLIRTN